MKKEFAKTGVYIGKVHFSASNGASGWMKLEPSSYHPDNIANTIEWSLVAAARGMDQAQFDAYHRIRLEAHPDNGGDIRTAHDKLRAAGFTVLWSE